MVSTISTFFRKNKYVFWLLLFLPHTYIKRVLIGKDPIWKKFFFQSWGRLPLYLKRNCANSKVIWINTEAGGEITQLISFCKKVKAQFPDYLLLVSTHKYDAYELAGKIEGVDHAFFSPWDICIVVRRVLKCILPSILIGIEVATSPVLFREANRLKIKTFLASAFFSKTAEKSPLLERAVALKFYQYFDFIGVKSEKDRKAFVNLGYPVDATKVLGDLKYNPVATNSSGDKRGRLLSELGLSSESKVLIGGSLHPGEEKFIVDTYALLIAREIECRLIIAPRFSKFIGKVKSYLDQHGYAYIKKTEIMSGMDIGRKIIILDTFGELPDLYSVASYAFIGASLTSGPNSTGGHNLIEPIMHLVPTFHGPYVTKDREIVKEIEPCWNGLEVTSPEALAKGISILEEDRALRAKIKKKLLEIVNREGNSTEKHLRFLKRLL